MIITFQNPNKKTANNVYEYYILKDNEKIGSIDYNSDENKCYVIDYDLQEVLQFDDTSIIECVTKLAQGYVNYYQNLGEDITITDELLPW